VTTRRSVDLPSAIAGPLQGGGPVPPARAAGSRAARPPSAGIARPGAAGSHTEATTGGRRSKATGLALASLSRPYSRRVTP
jgi:hypothetical protein